jgi:hypothetical protein
MDDGDPRFYRQLQPGQRSSICVGYADGRSPVEILSATERLFEAPNWGPGDTLYLNADGYLWTMPSDGSRPPERLETPGLPRINNDHVFAPDLRHFFASANDGHIHEVPLDGRPARRVTARRRGQDAWHYLHGVGPGARTLLYTGQGPEGADGFDIFSIGSEGGEPTRLTHGPGHSDGAEFSPDGEWILFNTEMFSTRPGHAQIARMRPDGTELEQLTFDDRVNWFPHVAPTGGHALYLSYPSGTIGHPADKQVEIMVVARDWSAAASVASLHGGQGTINVNSWSPDGTRFAFVAYPLGARARV